MATLTIGHAYYGHAYYGHAYYGHAYYGHAYYGHAYYGHLRGLSSWLQLINKMVVVALIYGTAFPALYGLGFLFCLVAHWIDRYNLLRRFAPPPPTSDRLIAQWLRVVVPCSILLHMTFAVFLFRGKAAARGGGATAPPTLLAYANGALFGPLVVYFIYREWNLSKVCAWCMHMCIVHAHAHAHAGYMHGVGICMVYAWYMLGICMVYVLPCAITLVTLRCELIRRPRLALWPLGAP